MTNCIDCVILLSTGRVLFGEIPFGKGEVSEYIVLCGQRKTGYSDVRMTVFSE